MIWARSAASSCAARRACESRDGAEGGACYSEPLYSRRWVLLTGWTAPAGAAPSRRRATGRPAHLEVDVLGAAALERLVEHLHSRHSETR